jgi:putative endonuclease
LSLFFVLQKKRNQEIVPHTVYALYSPDHDKIYIGRSGNFEQRLISHNQKGKKGWTIKYRPWKVVFTEEFQTKEEAIHREKQLKTSRGRTYVWQKVNEKFKR